MSAVPGEPLKRKPHDVTLKDGRKVRLKLPGMPPSVEPATTKEAAAAEPARESPAPRQHPEHGAS
ncbi:MAG TPA: hypothetical protein VGF63_12805 [Solirubrobacteraceae bacterium]|jgi:hypothetical protein